MIKEDFLAGFSRVKIQLAQSHAPHAGAGTSFRERTKVSKGLPRGEFRFSPLGSPLNDQRLCLWKPGGAPDLEEIFRTGTSLCAQLVRKKALMPAKTKKNRSANRKHSSVSQRERFENTRRLTG
ncbi:hypothetical protein [Faecalispora anaeroviscerum]|uniref:hypothetical protein n=1 Tax=Faecalispora anaeroviscerum TaxID=2991836 RepID=UPI0024B98BA0|nr:hypothetical protein [Faecalispora anaeroviscerum]